ncbi:hypothetical protein A2690_04260 [Candidatus Roizmanbacteria bacterium RIFCSPHIGHO2_01_FULL_39_12b]|uniref:Uncharacterized protein n=1 Tax=Candidatus Roizmanbacteria bacterium RIFCSPHIGHO2_01_FULL_39_12b TaxID=1802030 RepID=A0A1F7GCE5_9BACT|nr:MAG: hypothetical protein A2690_04260 [Candidatus Roizmanbacteria bacterium RIFCSPHIGHO2_01_FULL_39_12b]OGK47154.1 MAG: hypothetical protein A3B46_01985 [Candidatus Roizmanbacteria bacterium RIFCSPLOWO2_01_FULL_39_19]
MGKFTDFARIAEIEYSDIVISCQDLGIKLRIYLTDKSFIDFFYTTKLKATRFAIHWERKHIDNTIYRIDNTPDKKWSKVVTFPTHFHKKTYDKVTVPPFKITQDEKLAVILRRFLQFARSIIKINGK